ncbi:unnamed protein product, partial [Ectocarpus sp. 12 AP-2014]
PCTAVLHTCAQEEISCLYTGFKPRPDKQSMLSLALARRVRCRQSGQATRLARTAAAAATRATRGIVRQRVTYVTASATPEKQQHQQASSPSRSSFLSSSVLRPAAGTSWTRHEATPQWTMTSAPFGGGVDFSDVGGSGCGGRSSSGWRNRRTFFGVATTAGNDGGGQDGEAAAAETEAAATATTGGAGPGRAEATSVVGEGSDEISTRGAGGE